MKLHVFTQKDELPKLPNNLTYPSITGSINFMRLTIPQFEFGKTYYKLEKDNLIAFRVFGICYCPNTCYYLIQLPNKEVSWDCEFIKPACPIFANKQDMYDYLNGNTNCNINFPNNNSKNIDIDTNGYTIENNHLIVWKQCPNDIRPKKMIAPILRLVILPNDVICQTYIANDTFFSKLDCMKDILNNTTITTFEEEFSFRFDIPSNKPKQTKLLVYEYAL